MGARLMLVGGPSGSGKSTIRSALVGTLEVVMLESDVLWRPEYEGNHDMFRRVWLRLASDISLSGRPVVLFGAGFAVPHNVEPLPERAAFDRVDYLALVCDDDALRARIRGREPPRRTDDEHLNEQLDFNRWLRANASTKSISLIDTTHITIDEAASRVAAWIRSARR